MKAHITPSQAQELTEQQFYSLFDEIVHRDDWYSFHHKKMNTGKMIELLGGVSICRGGFHNQWRVHSYGVHYESDTLVDALWSCVKASLKQNTIPKATE